MSNDDQKNAEKTNGAEIRQSTDGLSPGAATAAPSRTLRDNRIQASNRPWVGTFRFGPCASWHSFVDVDKDHEKDFPAVVGLPGDAALVKD
jgi:hypothetical protein